AAVLRFDGDRLAVVDCSLALSRREEYEVVGTDGRLTVPVAFLPGTADAEIRIMKGTNRSTETIPGVNQYQLMVEHFADVVTGRAPLALPPEDAVANLRVIEAALRSVKSSHVEAVEP
ncbi:MAG: Gfo/Idh/MocA family oxidoreductase, partial [Tepidisphaeraceae bacterium]